MASFGTGKKFYNINKNLESGPGVYYSDLYARTRFSPDLSILPRKENPELQEVEKLKHMLNEKESQLQRLRENIDRSNEEITVNPVYPELVMNSAYDSKQCVEIYDSHFKYLNQQIKEKEKFRIEENLKRQKETQDRLQQMYQMKEMEILERRRAAERAEDYRNSLLMQQNFNRQIEYERKTRSVTPRNENKSIRKSFINAHNILNSPDRVPVLTKDHVVPATKNINRITPELSQLFQQPKYTKQSPKFQPSYPVIGSRLGYNFNQNELVNAAHGFYAA
jgi:hypothetical protein